MGKLILPDQVEWSLLRQKATSAAPGLSANARAIQDIGEFKKYKQDVNFSEAIQSYRNLDICDNGRTLSNHEAKIGKRLSSTDLEKRLKSLNPNIHVEPAMNYPGILGVYVLGNFGTLPNGQSFNKKFVCRMDRGWLTEGDISNIKYVRRLVQTDPPVWDMVPEVDEDSLGHKDVGLKRGWRSILATLLKGGYITESGVFRVFGPPTWDSARWQSVTT